MAYKNVSITGEGWFNINTLSECPVGNAFQIQNLSSSNCYLQESELEPTTLDGPILYNSSFGELSIATVSAGSLSMWCRLGNSSDKLVLAVY